MTFSDACKELIDKRQEPWKNILYRRDENPPMYIWPEGWMYGLCAVYFMDGKAHATPRLSLALSDYAADDWKILSPGLELSIDVQRFIERIHHTILEENKYTILDPDPVEDVIRWVEMQESGEKGEHHA